MDEARCYCDNYGMSKCCRYCQDKGKALCRFLCLHLIDNANECRSARQWRLNSPIDPETT
jgi:hypothetical protein